MHKLYKLVFVLFVTLVAINIKSNNVVAGDALPKIVISQTQAGALSSEDNAPLSEFVSIYNNEDVDVDISGWCLINKSSIVFACFVSDDNNKSYILPSHSYANVASSNLFAKKSEDSFFLDNVDIVFDVTDSRWGSIVAGGDTIELVDLNIEKIDTVQWTSAIPSGSSWHRLQDADTPDILVDSGKMTDFEKQAPLIIHNSGLITKDMPDLCNDIDGIQGMVPAGLKRDESGNCLLPIEDVCLDIVGIQTGFYPESEYMKNSTGACVIDVCTNMPEFQTEIPAGKDFDIFGKCVDHDECSNLPEIQSWIPEGFVRGEENTCILNLPPIYITELLPNPAGSDDGNEYIEIYNPNDSEVDLTYYIFYVGSDDLHFYSFPLGANIAPKQYLKFSDNDIKFTLVNTTSSVRLKTIDNSFTDLVPAYNNSTDGQAWALINSAWQWTNRPTPGASNLESLIEVIDNEINEPEGLKPCEANQYRNPLTNRCKLIPEYESQLLPCADGQYRSEETNRCRNIANDVVNLVPCAEGQERNPATNRCRMIASEVANLVPCAEGQERNPLTNRCRAVSSVLGTSDLVPCKEGQERSPETNRCRNIVSMPTAEYAPEKTSEKTDDNSLIFVVIGLVAVAVGYGVWEWRREIVKNVKKLTGRLKKVN